jgi:hypothetical protein
MNRVALFAALSAVCLLVTVGYVAFRVTGVHSATPVDAPAAATGLQEVLAQSHLLFVDTTNPSHMRLAAASLKAPETDRVVSSIACDRVYFSSGHGLCSGSEEHYYGNRGVADFDAQLQPVHTRQPTWG